MDLSYNAIMSVLSDSIKQSIQPLLPPTLKYGPILWIYVVCEVRTASFQRIKSLKTQLEMLKLQQTPGENVKTFTTRFLQICLDLGKNVPSDAPFKLNEQLSTSSVEQFRVKFMARSGAVSEWVTRIHGMSKAAIDARSGDDNYISIQTLVEEANAEYTMLMASNRWGPQGKQDPSGAPEALFTKTELNTFVQKQVSAALKGKKPGSSDKTSTNPVSTSSSNSSSKCACFNCGSPDHLKKDCPHDAKKNRVPKAAWKANPPTSNEPQSKNVDGKSWHWCQHCGFWRLSHGTSGHKDPSTLPPLPQRGSQHTQPAASTAENTTLMYCGPCMFNE